MNRHITTLLTAALTAGSIVAVVPGASAAALGPELASVTTAGTPIANAYHGQSSGRWIAFTAGSTDRVQSVYVHDQRNGTTVKAYTGAPGEDLDTDLSGDGRHLAVQTSTSAVRIIDLDTGAVHRLPGNFTALSDPSVSSNGRWLAFSGVQGPAASHAYRWNVQENKVTRVSDNGDEATGTVISPDGRKVAYADRGHAYAVTVSTGRVQVVDIAPGGTAAGRSDARPIAFSDSGTYLLFDSASPDLGPSQCVDECLYRRNLTSGKVTLASVLPDGTTAPSIVADLSGDGRVVTFVERRGNSTSQAYARRFSTARTVLISKNADGQAANEPSSDVSAGSDGKAPTFSTSATNLGASVEGSGVWVAYPGDID